MKKIFVHIIVGCERRCIDAQRICDYFSENNCNIINDPKKADYIIFVTCGVTNIVAESCFYSIKKFQEKYDAELIVAGCLPAIQPKRLAQIFNGKTIVTEDLNQNPSKIDRLFPENKIKFRDIKDANIVDFENIKKDNLIEKIKTTFETIQLKRNFIKIYITLMEKLFVNFENNILKLIFDEKSYICNILAEYPVYRVRVSWGCTGNCSYCGIKKAVGPNASKPLDLCLNEFKKGLKEGYKNFHITADDIGAYGLDIGSSLPELLDKITEIDGDYKLDVYGLNPVWVVKYIDELEKIIRRGKIKLMLCAFQSGSSRILKSMNRYNDVEKIKDAYKRLRNSYPELIIGPHIMLGFPTETEEDVQKTLDFVKEINFGSGQIFSYSNICGTKAAEMEPKVPQKVLSKRIKYVKKSLKKEGYHVIWTRGVGVFYKKN